MKNDCIIALYCAFACHVYVIALLLNLKGVRVNNHIPKQYGTYVRRLKFISTFQLVYFTNCLAIASTPIE